MDLIVDAAEKTLFILEIDLWQQDEKSVEKAKKTSQTLENNIEVRRILLLSDALLGLEIAQK